ncbi:MAG TPA: DUF4288 domain-containing protein [Chitinophagaceae bacterium]|jgi:hypothetical protein|nr:DUF4288 domain-containing protein [Chitinophagaceae bacterium]
MDWYIAKIVYQILVSGEEQTAQFEEQLRLIQADSKQEALDKATSLGEQEESVFYNYRDQPVYWKFLDVPELQPVQQLNDGLQLYSHLEQPEYAESYLALMESKAESVRTDKEYLF